MSHADVLRPADRADPGAAGGVPRRARRRGRALPGPARVPRRAARRAAAGRHRERRPARGDRGGVAAARSCRRSSCTPASWSASGPDGGPPYHLAFSAALGDCPRCGPALQGGAPARAAAARRVVLVFGDGASDLCPAREADLTFARDHLAERCAAEGLPWRPLPDFTRVWARSTRGWRGAERDARDAGAAAAGAGAAGPARPSRRSPAGAARPLLLVVAAVALQALVWASSSRCSRGCPGTASTTSRTSLSTCTTKDLAGPAHLPRLRLRVPAAGDAAAPAAAARRPPPTRTGSAPR